MRISLHQKCLIVVALPVILAVIFIASLSQLLQQAESDLRREVFASQVMARTGELHRLFFEAVYACFMFNTTRSEKSAAQFDELTAQIPIVEQHLADELSHSEYEREMMRKAQTDGKLALSMMKQIRNGQPPELGGMIDARMLQREGQKINRKLFDDYIRIYDYAKKIREQTPSSTVKNREGVVLFLWTGVILNLLLAVGLAVYLTRAVTGRLRVVSDNAVRLARNAPLNPPIGGSDELSALDRVFRSMADAIAEASRKERALVENASEVLCSLDKSLKFVTVSAAAYKVWGYEPDALVQTRLRNLLPEEDADQTMKNFQELIASSEERSFNGSLIGRSGEVMELRWFVYWSEREQSLFCVSHDVTQELKLERLKQQLMGTVAHDLRVPLTSIKATLGLLSEGILGELSEKARMRVATAEKESDRLVRLINDLLDFDRLESGRLNLDLKEVDLDQAIAASLESVTNLARVKEIHIHAPECGMRVLADFDRLVQVIVNVLSNAIKFSARSTTVQIEVAQVSGFAKVMVVDQGPGIAPEHRSVVFERFRQIDTGDNNGALKGSGLGLPIARELVTAHGGSIGVDSSPGEGSTFWFTVPLADDLDKGD